LLGVSAELQRGGAELIGIFWQVIQKRDSTVVGIVAHPIHKAKQQYDGNTRTYGPWHTPSLEAPHNWLQHERQQQRRGDRDHYQFSDIAGSEDGNDSDDDLCRGPCRYMRQKFIRGFYLLVCLTQMLASHGH
jgi:hypothetical protein